MDQENAHANGLSLAVAPAAAARDFPADSAAAALKDLSQEEFTELCEFLLKVLRPMVRNYQDAEDRVQDALLKALTQKELVCIRAWTRFVVRRDAITEMRRARSRERRFVHRIDLDEVQGPTESSAELELEEFREAVRAAVGQLPADLEAVVKLKLKDRSDAETADALGIPVHTVRYRLRKGRARLAVLLAPYP